MVRIADKCWNSLYWTCTAWSFVCAKGSAVDAQGRIRTVFDLETLWDTLLNICVVLASFGSSPEKQAHNFVVVKHEDPRNTNAFFEFDDFVFAQK